MAKCGDCLYFGFCKKYIDPEETFPEIGGCHTFKNKDALVEVVRCKDCQHWHHMESEMGDCTNGRFHLDGHPAPTMEMNGYCSCGERREGE